MALLHFPSPAMPAHRALSLGQKPSNSYLLTASPNLNHGIRSPIITTMLPERPSKTSIRVSLSENQEQPSVSALISDGDGETPSSQVLSAPEVVRSFYGGINRHDLPAVERLIAENCVYEDLIFPRPFVGREGGFMIGGEDDDIMAFFNKFIGSISTDLQFVIDDISSEDTAAVGVSWHLEWNGTPFPFSKGCSFYRLEVLNGTRQIVYARDCAEPAIKPGESTLGILSSVTWLLQRFPQLVKWL